jgi:crotonobetainyl-CoA:carnitine CoA-transferase CaiB-like acyl-CoA transferase
VARVVEAAGHPSVYAGRLLAEAGHEVIRVEPPGGDDLRRMGPYLGEHVDAEHGAYHQFFNAGKRSLTLDLASKDGQAVWLDLLRTADVAIVSFPTTVDAAKMKQLNPRLVVVEVEGEDRPELCAYARAGLLSLTGHPDETPVLMGGHVIYAATGLWVSLAAAAGLLVQRLTGRGQVSRVDVQQCMEVFYDHAADNFVTTGKNLERRGFRGNVTAASGAFPCADGYWMLSVSYAPERWAKVMDWMQDPVLMNDASLAEEAGRAQKKDLILDRIAAWSQGFKKQEAVTEAQRRRITASPVSTTQDLVEDPQLMARGFLKEIEHPEFGRMLFPMGASASLRGRTLSLAPRLGEHTAEILSELGYRVGEQRMLCERGIV